MVYSIIPISQPYIEGFCKAVGSVSQEKKYLSFLEGPSLEMSRGFVLKNIEEGAPHFIAIIDSKVVGWCDITSQNRPIFNHSGILGIGVIQKYRGLGIGSALLKKAIEEAKFKGLERIELTVREKNLNAINLYKKFGFEVEGLKKRAVKVDGEYENIVCMALIF